MILSFVFCFFQVAFFFPRKQMRASLFRKTANLLLGIQSSSELSVQYLITLIARKMQVLCYCKVEFVQLQFPAI